jgi:hypothetical protein
MATILLELRKSRQGRVPPSRAHDELLSSTALTARLDEID